MTSMRKFILLFIVLACSLAFGIYSYQYKSQHAPVGSLLQQATYLHDQQVAIPEFRLTNHEQKLFTVDNIRNKWTFWFFGFTHCPDICPITLGTLSAAVEQLQSEHDVNDAYIIFVSVDPDRDHPEQLKTYVTAFSQKVIGVTTNQQDLDAFMKNLGVVAVKQENENSPTEYLINHSSSVFLIAPDTGINAIFGSPHTVADIKQDFLTLRDHYAVNE